MDTIKIIFPIKFNKSLPKITDSVEILMAGLNDLIKIGALKGNLDDILLDYDVDKDTGYIEAILKKDALVDASKLNTSNSSLSHPLDLNKIKDYFEIENRSYSASSIQERLRLTSLDPKQRFRYIILDYKRYFNQKKSKLEKDPVQIKRLKDMFLVDMMGIFNDIMPALVEGKQLAQLTGLNNVSDGLVNVSKNLSLAYRRALKQAKDGAISKNNLQDLQKQYATFMNLLIPQVFPGIDKIPGVGVKSYSDTNVDSSEFGWLKLTTNSPEKYQELLNKIKESLSSDDVTEVTLVVNNNPKSSVKFNKSDNINSIDFGKIQSNIVESSKEYSYTSEGRIKLFS